MMVCRRARSILAGLIAFPLLFASSVHAQRPGQPQPMCQAGCGGGGDPTYSVSVSANTGGPTVAPNATGQTFAFTVHNYGTAADTYTMSCSTTGSVSCDGLDTYSLYLPAGTGQTVTATFSVGNPGTDGYLTLYATGTASASDLTFVTVATPSTSPTVLIAHNEAVKSLTTCALTCFDKVFAHATPAYFTLDAPRSFGIVYNSATVKPTPVLLVDVSPPATGTVTSYKVEVRRSSDNVLLTLLNGSTAVYYAPGSGTRRLAAPIDWLALGLSAPAVLPVRVTVTANLSAGGPTYTTIATQLVAVSQVGSVFGNGVGAVPQAFATGPGYYSIMFVEPDGSSAFFYRANSGSGYTTPGGLAVTVTQNAGADWLRRTAMDGSYQEFSWATGRLRKVVGRFGATTSYYWTGALLDSIVDPMGKKLSLGYASGKLATVTDPIGRVTRYTVNGSGYLTTITDPDTVSTALGYTAAGLLTTVTGRNGAVWTTAYDSLNRIQADSAPSITLYDGTTGRPTATYTAPDRVYWQVGTAGTSSGTAKASMPYDSAAASTVNPLGASTRFATDRFGAPTRIVDVLAQTTTVARDSMGRPTDLVEPNGHHRAWGYVNGSEYDYAHGMPFNYPPYLLINDVDYTASRTLSYQYNPLHDVSRVVGGPVQQDFTYYNGSDGGPAGALKSTFLAGGSTAVTTHYPDALGRDTAVVDAGGHRGRSMYEGVLGDLYQTVNSIGATTRLHIDLAGRADSAYAPNGTVTGTSFGLLNQVLTTRDQLGHVTTTLYNPDLTVGRIVDAKGQVYKFAYNALGALVTRYDLADTTLADTLKYDAGGQLRQTRTRRGHLLQYSYNAAGQITNRDADGVWVAAYAYDPAGRWLVAASPTQADSIAYDGLGRVAAWASQLDYHEYRWNYTYDSQSRLTGRTMAIDNTVVTTGNLSRTYDSYGQLTSTTAAGVTIGLTRTGADSLPTKRRVNSAHPWSMSTVFDANHRPTYDTLSVPSVDNIFGGRVFYDSLNRLTRRDGQASLEQALYAYDAAGQLLQACAKVTGGCQNEYGVVANVTVPSYTYDAAGNRTDSAAAAIVGAGNRLLRFKGDTLTYDADGNIATKVGHGKSWSYTWDGYDRLTDVYESGVLVMHMGYDAFDRRIAISNNNSCSGQRHIWDGDQFAFATNCYGVVVDEYGWYPGSEQLLGAKFSGRTGVVMTDHALGSSVLGVVDADSSANPLIKTYNTTAWGESPADTGAVFRLRMAAQQYDQATGLYYMRARFYDPELGKFLSEDPIGIEGGMNLYAYAGNDPVNNADPSGLDAQCEWVGEPIPSHYESGPPVNGELPPVHVRSRRRLVCHGTPPDAPSGGERLTGAGGGHGDEATDLVRAPNCKRLWLDFAKDLALDALLVNRLKNVERGLEAVRTIGRSVYPLGRELVERSTAFSAAYSLIAADGLHTAHSAWDAIGVANGASSAFRAEGLGDAAVSLTGAAISLLNPVAGLVVDLAHSGYGLAKGGCF